MESVLKREINKMEKRDRRTRRARYAPKQNGLPLGYPKSYWLEKKLSHANQQTY